MIVVSSLSLSLFLVLVNFLFYPGYVENGLVGMDRQREDIRLAGCNEARST